MLVRIDQREKYGFVGEIVLKNNARLQARIYGPQNVVLSRRRVGSGGSGSGGGMGWDSASAGSAGGGDSDESGTESEMDEERRHRNGDSGRSDGGAGDGGKVAPRLTTAAVAQEIVRKDLTGTLRVEDVIELPISLRQGLFNRLRIGGVYAGHHTRLPAAHEEGVIVLQHWEHVDVEIFVVPEDKIE